MTRLDITNKAALLEASIAQDVARDTERMSAKRAKLSGALEKRYDAMKEAHDAFTKQLDSQWDEYVDVFDKMKAAEEVGSGEVFCVPSTLLCVAA